MHEHSLGFTVNHFFGYPPRSIPGNGFPTVGTFSLLAFPNTDYRIPTFCRLEHQTGFPFFKILCPIWVVGVCITFKLCIAGNFSIRQPLNRVQFLPTVLVERCGENPRPAPVFMEISLCYPPFPFRWMSSERPLQKFLVDMEVHFLEHFARYHVLVIIRPSGNDRIKKPNKRFLRDSFVRIDNLVNLPLKFLLALL